MIDPERRSLKGWATYLMDPDLKHSREEAQLHAIMSIADRMVEQCTILTNVQIRLQRIELWIEKNDPDYSKPPEPPSYQPALPGPEQENDREA